MAKKTLPAGFKPYEKAGAAKADMKAPPPKPAKKKAKGK